MGANQSSSEARSVAMDNPNPTSVIDVSEEVVERLKLGLSKANAATNKLKQESKEQAKPVPPPQQPQPPAAVITPPKSAPLPKTTTITPTPAPLPQQTSPYARFPGEPTITSVEMRRQKELELQQNDQMWRARLVNLEQTLNKTNAVMEKEYSAAVEDVRKRFMNASPTHQLPPCQDLKAQLIACYRAYPGETLKCAEEVALFRNCVGVHRIKRLDAEQAAAKGA